MRRLVRGCIARIGGHPNTLARHVKRAISVERIDIDVSHPADRTGLVSTPIQVLGAVVVTRGFCLHRGPGLAAVYCAENFIALGPAIHGDRHQSPRMLDIDGDASVSELVVLRRLERGYLRPDITLALVFPDTTRGLLAWSRLVGKAHVQRPAFVKFSVARHQPLGLLGDRTPASARVGTSV